MVFFKTINKLLGALLFFIITLPWICLATIASAFIFLDHLFQFKLVSAVVCIFATPLTVIYILAIGIASALRNGFNMGISDLLSSAPARIAHFFKTELWFGARKNESVSRFFKSAAIPTGYDSITGTRFFGRMTLKFFTLVATMENYVAYKSLMASPHTDVSIYYTDSVLKQLQNKYQGKCNGKKLPHIMREIDLHLKNQLALANKTLIKTKRPAKIQVTRDNIKHIKASLRCLHSLKSFSLNPVDIKVAVSVETALAYVWLAIQHEAKDKTSQDELKYKLMMCLFQIQRGFNLTAAGSGADMRECTTGALGLLVRVICNEQTRMPGSTYVALDPTPANLTEVLKVALDRPFTSQSGMIILLTKGAYARDPDKYKAAKKAEVKDLWKQTYAGLFKPAAKGKKPIISEKEIDQLIEAGVDAWEPPAPH